jgi:hypothetical protein
MATAPDFSTTWAGSEDADPSAQKPSAQEDVMNEKERDAYAREKEEQMREDEARLAMAEAHARETNATEQLNELTGLKAFQTKQRDRLELFKEATRENSEKMKADFDADCSEFATKFDAIKAKLDQVDQARERKLDAQLDQLDQEIVVIDSKIQREVIGLVDEDKKELNRAKAAYGKAVQELKRTLQDARQKIGSHRPGAS